MSELVPFDPKRHKAQDAVSLGIPGAKKGDMATEYSASEKSPDGKYWNIPQVWFNKSSGEAIFIRDIDRAWDLSKRYEGETGNKFPRFDSMDSAVKAARERSKGGGATRGTLAQRKRLLFRKD